MHKIAYLAITVSLVTLFCKKRVEPPPSSGSSSSGYSSTPSYTPPSRPTPSSSSGDYVSQGGTATVRETVVLRQAPSADAERATCQRWHPNPPRDCGSGCMQSFSILETGEDATIVGRTATMSTVGKWRNYWYEIKPPGNGCDSKEVWVYGELLNIY